MPGNYDEDIIQEQSGDVSRGTFSGTFGINRGGGKYVITNPSFPVGQGTNIIDWVPAIIPALGEVPAFPTAPNWPEAAPLPEEIDRRDQPQVQTQLPPEPSEVMPEVGTNATISLEEYMLRRAGPPAIPRVLDPTQPIYVETIVSAPEEENDVGIIEDFYQTVDASLGGILPGGVPIGTVPPQWDFGFGTPAAAPPPVVYQDPLMAPLQPAPGVPTVAASCDNDPMKGMVYKRVCGQWKWVKKKFRRRKALVTQTDLRGLASLKGVLGTGKAFEVWIATHS